MPPFTVLHVCMGNICRSPMAERLLLLAVRERLARLDVDPAGSDAWSTASTPFPSPMTSSSGLPKCSSRMSTSTPTNWMPMPSCSRAHFTIAGSVNT